ncbi:purine phosphorylase [Crocosphaera sp. XPORK-15E]|uniref:5'-methylthioadenosine/S-adenosylhomocysteine nucleosidase family protein n=1 Tax=Crocosphaera sp. XPORK-15E TaxID=3110247 RepID=UPI002B1EA58B|nr:purine phosphorylase [Crocosphaera sp. XPORK-15E]MEA5534964.1 purine phosphorylase [Crocosphaera sp. XPORK-15E]
MLSRTPLTHQINRLLVPQGMEYQAVCRGIKQTSANLEIIAIPVGIKPLTDFLRQWQQTPEFLNKSWTGLMVMGLGGSLSPKYRVGDVVLYRDCGDIQPIEEQWYHCDAVLSELVFQRLENQLFWGRGITSDRVISSAEEKRLLGQKYQGDVVDMEGIAILKWCQGLDIPLVMLRVISDNCQQDLPDLTPAFGKDGGLQPLILARQMLKNPSNSIHLIQSSLQSLKVLQQVTTNLFV